MSDGGTPIWTPEQRRGIETTGRSLLVSAAAGSGKTAVLAARCAHLVTDARPPCDIDRLLVVTFTEAAAAEMRSRIVEAVRLRARRQPENVCFAAQAARIDAAQISTIHSFCLRLVRRWFTEAGVDPAASLLDEKETVLWKNDTIEQLFAKLYAELNTPGDPLGGKQIGAGPELAGDALCHRFAQLVSDYELGNDRGVAEFVIRLADFVASLPAPDS